MAGQPGVEELKAMAFAKIDERAEDIKNIGRTIWHNPELGFKEKKTAQLMVDVLKDLGVSCRTGIAVTGLKGTLKGRSAVGTVGVVGELDCVVCPEHPAADPDTGGAHSCGHHAQVTIALGCAMALAASGVMNWLDGDVQILGIPAEEYVELGYRDHLVKKGVIPFMLGKASWIALGEFDDIDLYLATHTSIIEDKIVSIDRGGTNGLVGKLVRFRGREAHAGGAPHLGVNALNAANIALVALNAQRETFLEKDTIRIHPIVTKGGDLVNVVPADVRLESYVRGHTVEGILDASKKFDRSMQAGALAVGAEVDLQTMPGALGMQPKLVSQVAFDLFVENASRLFGADKVRIGSPTDYSTGSNDVADVMHVIPTASMRTTGVAGVAHSKEFTVVDEDRAYIAPSKVMAATVIDLLAGGASPLKKVKADYQPVYNKETYVKMWREFVR